MYHGEPTAIAASPNANTAIHAPRSRDRTATHASANPSSPNCTSAVAFVPSAKPVSTPATTAQRRSIGASGGAAGPSAGKSEVAGAVPGPSKVSGSATEPGSSVLTPGPSP